MKLWGAKKASDASKDAAKLQEAAVRRAIARETEYMDRATTMSQPWTGQGAPAQRRLSELALIGQTRGTQAGPGSPRPTGMLPPPPPPAPPPSGPPPPREARPRPGTGMMPLQQFGRMGGPVYR